MISRPRQVPSFANKDSIVSLLVLLLGIAACLALFTYTASNERNQARLHFRLLAEESISSIENKITENSTIVSALAAHFDASNSVTRREFAIFVRPFLQKNKSIRALQWVPRVLNRDRQRYEAQARRDGLTGFHFKEWSRSHVSKTAGVRSDYFVVYYNEPLAANTAVTGLDNGSEPIRRQVLLECARRGSETYSPPVVLMQAKASQRGYLIYLPVYDRSAAISTPQQRLEHLKGFATGVFLIDELLKSALDWRDTRPICLDIVDVTDPRHVQPLGSIGDHHTKSAGLSCDRFLTFGNRRWRLHATPGESYVTPHPLLAWIRLVFTVLLVVVGTASMVFRMRAMRMLRENERRFRQLFNALPVGALLFDPESLRTVFFNDAAARNLGYIREEFAKLRLPDIELTHDDTMINQTVARLLQGEKLEFEVRHRAKSGKARDTLVNAMQMDVDGRQLVLAMWTDITERKRAESQIRLRSAAMNAADDLIAILDSCGRAVFVNEAFGRQTGYTPEEITGQEMSVWWPQPQISPAVKEARRAAKRGLAWKGEMSCTTKDGSAYTADVTITPLSDEDGQSEYKIMIARNITQRKEYEGLLDYQAHHDSLTNLPNRLFFTKELDSVVTGHDRQHKRCAVLFIDLDNFKMVNDTMGHQAGDELLVQTATRLASCMRDEDTLARMGGDEFTVLLNGLRSTDDVAAIAQRMLDQVSEPMEVGGSKLVIGASIGVSTYPDNATDAAGLLKAADAAMYRAKALGRNNCQFFSEELSRANLARVEMESDLRLAIERGEFRVYYQPIVDAATMRVAGAEALLRWEHPEKGMISPGLFIPVAEETGLILQIGQMVLETACRQCKDWQNAGYPDFEMSVNVSPLQLRKAGFPLAVLDILDCTGLSPESLNLEITETVLAQNEYGEIDSLGKLRELGVKTSLDDFGIGYSSLSSLKDLPIVHMKVDGSFIREIEHSPNDRAMTGSIVAMAHNLGITVTAEWIENEKQMAVVRLLGCDYAQGYMISPALPPAAFEAFMRKWQIRDIAA